MAIIEIVKGDGSEAPRRWSARFGWLVGIWAASTVAFFVGASLLHLLVPR
ncbi:DUF2474 domain-containing protein [Gluconacetobacter sp. 1b LMG 1731]|uniref:DUF2474 domain-containing protein n=1 Tax=Gluconacetobacter dulcium TaxID=2729096 RepID=A0A7W4PHU6_9PROT|nr:DUF2474 domain-containing protein [Gluconacetobacter dulcium]MBB2164912.1 DUF2474 domain-containing protein [Gluconacetobacter dulcium]MBB2194025.1 DUF2474 domain-containing protein [Gluconacetobacter dulcium]MBB2198532.1 DUF2474 domain-containing protein [Gluconacetobacter dulcium]